jgi:hypothetical protein
LLVLMERHHVAREFRDRGDQALDPALDKLYFDRSNQCQQGNETREVELRYHF